MKTDGQRVARARLLDVARDAGSRSRRRRGSSATPRKSPCGRAHGAGARARDASTTGRTRRPALRRAETGAIGLVIPSLATPVYARIVRGAFRRAGARLRRPPGGRRRRARRTGLRPARPKRQDRRARRRLGPSRPPAVPLGPAACDRPRLRQPRGARQRAQHRHGRLEASAPRSGTWWSSATSGSATLRGRRRSIRQARGGVQNTCPAAGRRVGARSRGRLHGERRRRRRAAPPRGEPGLTALYVSTLAQAVGTLHAAGRLGSASPRISPSSRTTTCPSPTT